MLSSRRVIRLVTVGLLALGLGSGASGILTFRADGTATSVGRSSTMNVTAASGAVYNLSDFTPPAGPPFTQHRICVRSTTADKLQGL